MTDGHPNVRHDDRDDVGDEQVIVQAEHHEDFTSSTYPELAYIDVSGSLESSGFCDSELYSLYTNSTPRSRSHPSFLRTLCDAADFEESSSGRGTGYYSESIGNSARHTVTSDRADSYRFDVCNRYGEDTESEDRFNTSDTPTTSTVSSSPDPGDTSPRKQRLLTKRQFHTTSFLRARYPSHLHKDEFAKAKQAFRPPACLCPPSRYGKEPRVQSAKPKTTALSKRRAEERLLKRMEKLHIGVQCVPEVCTCACQAETETKDNSTQSRETKTKSRGTQKGSGLRYVDKGTQCLTETKNKLVETSTRILYNLPMVNTRDTSTQYNGGVASSTASDQVQCQCSQTTSECVSTKPPLPTRHRTMSSRHKEEGV